MAKASRNGQMALFMKVNGLKINPPEKENLLMPMVMSMMDSGKMIKLMDMEFIYM